jgi:hypothetical protein
MTAFHPQPCPGGPRDPDPADRAASGRVPNAWCRAGAKPDALEHRVSTGAAGQFTGTFAASSPRSGATWVAPNSRPRSVRPVWRTIGMIPLPQRDAWTRGPPSVRPRGPRRPAGSSPGSNGGVVAGCGHVGQRQGDQGRQTYSWPGPAATGVRVPRRLPSCRSLAPSPCCSRSACLTRSLLGAIQGGGPCCSSGSLPASRSGWSDAYLRLAWPARRSGTVIAPSSSKARPGLRAISQTRPIGIGEATRGAVVVGGTRRTCHGRSYVASGGNDGVDLGGRAHVVSEGDTSEPHHRLRRRARCPQ